MLLWKVSTSTIPRIFAVVAALLIPQLGYATGGINMPTTCGDPIWGKKLWLYTGFYSIPFIEIEQSLLLEQLTGVERTIDRQDKIIAFASTITSVGNAMGAREAKEILSSAIGSASLVMAQNAEASGNFSFIIAGEIVDGAGELLDGLTDPPALARDLAIKLSNTFLNYINYWQITNLTNRLDFLRHVDEFMFSYYHSCGASSSLSSLTSSESSAVGNYLLGVNKTYASLESTNNPVPVILPTLGQLLPAPVLSASLVGAPVSITPTFSWSPVSGANKYWLMVAENQADLPRNTAATGCQNCVISGSTFQTTYTPPNAFSNIGRPD